MDIYIDTINGENIAIYEWKPEGEVRDIVYYFHGTQSYSLWFNDVANQMVKEGVYVISIDRVGCGYSPGEREHIKDIDETITLYAEFVNRYSHWDVPITFIGQSFGGAISLGVYFSNKLECVVDNIVLVTSYLGKLHRLDECVSVYNGDKTKKSLNFKTLDFTDVNRYIRFIDNDPLKWDSITNHSIYQSYLLEERYLKADINKFNLKQALYLYPELDPLVDVNYAKEIFNKIFKNRSETQSIPFDRHFVWFSSYIDEVTDRIISWIRRCDEY
ncbi:alpha/beta hydrolase [Vibrio mangrovi]|uniref:Alpha/beta hydrolase n=1 Tax=Vibrio mangrovi TaxID=474394 RepID=A0A1Y6IQC4_9VIBR|nr:alpha/beta hydrolase [Vibrio mangrovi]MDW6003382.1 alpha/beta hydrolase [Vibrio mangrovi]SMR99828.1 Putative lysophospholipase [Vibrio mangrovi]